MHETRGRLQAITANDRERGELEAQAQQAFALESLAASSARAYQLQSGPPQRFTIGVDYGATQTSVAFCTSGPDRETDHLIRPENVHKVKNWPGEDLTGGLAEKMPTKCWYPEVPIERHSRLAQDASTSDEIEDRSTNMTRRAFAAHGERAGPSQQPLGYL